MKSHKKIILLLLLSTKMITTAYAADSHSTAQVPVLDLGGDQRFSSSSPPMKRGVSEQPATHYVITLWGKNCSFEKEQFDKALLLFKGGQVPLTNDLWLEEISAFIVKSDGHQKNRASQTFLTDLTAGYQPVLGGQYFHNLYAFLILLFQHAADKQLVPEQEAIAEALRIFGDENTIQKQLLAEAETAKAESAETIADLRRKLEVLENIKGELERVSAEETRLKVQAIREKTQAADRIVAAEAARAEAVDAQREIERRVAELKRTLEHAQTEVEQNTAQSTDLQHEQVALKDALEEAIQQKNEAKLTADRNEEVQRILQEQIDAEKRRAEQLQFELTELKRTSATAIQQVTTEQGAGEQRIAVAEAARLDAERNAAESEEAQRALQEQLRLAESRVGVLEGQNGTLQVQVNSIAGLNADIVRLRRDLEAAKALAARVPGLDAQLLELQNALDAARAEPVQPSLHAAMPAQPSALPQNGRFVFNKGNLPPLGGE